MQRDNLEELTTLIRQLEEHVKFYLDMGLKEYGGAAVPSKAGFPEIPKPEREDTLMPDSSIPPDIPIIPEKVESINYETASPRVEKPQELPNEVRDTPGNKGSYVQAGLFDEPAINQPIALSKTASILASPSLITLPDDKSLDDIRADIGDCTRCKLHQNRTNIVFGEGNPKAELVFVGEGPGADEDETGRPFVGRAGQLLNRIIEAIGFKRADVYIANVVKCRPPGNRAPEKDEADTCEQFLFRQLRFIKPRVIVTLGAPALQCLLKSKEPITKVRGQWREWEGIRLMPTFHPAYLLRSPDKKRETWEDMKNVRDFLHGSM